MHFINDLSMMLIAYALLAGGVGISCGVFAYKLRVCVQDIAISNRAALWVWCWFLCASAIASFSFAIPLAADTLVGQLIFRAFPLVCIFLVAKRMYRSTIINEVLSGHK